jgi:radical SAM enzyme (rSAM/lipoprotein system)
MINDIKIDFKRKLALKLFKKIRKNVTKKHVLTYLFWECTLRCNLNCIHCGSDCTVNSNIDDMPLEDFIAVIDDIKTKVNPNKTMIVLTGGEPLMRKDIEQCGIELYKRGFPWGMVTNGFMLDQNRFESLMNSGLRSLTISLDGLEKEHDFFRGRKSSFEKAINAIKIAAKAQNLVFDVVTSVSKLNYHQLLEIKNLLINLKVKNWRLFTVFPVGRAAENPDLKLDNKQFRGLMDFIVNTRVEGKIKASYGCEGFLGNYEAKVRDNFFFCQAGISVGSVLADGSVSACPSLRDNFIQGNIYKEKFTNIWENKFQIMRNRSWTKTGKCADCKSYQYCEGNGLHLRNEKTGELLLCHLEKISN